MNNSKARFLMSLAALGLTKRELRALLKSVRSLPVDYIVEEVESLSEFHPGLDDEPTFTYSFSHSIGAGSSVGDRVEHLLKNEANLTGPQAHKRLSKMLVDLGLIKPGAIPPLSKKAIRVWVDKLVLLGIPEKELLRLATIARNELVHSPNTDWKLTGRKR